jgi:hypothetical protein
VLFFSVQEPDLGKIMYDRTFLKRCLQGKGREDRGSGGRRRNVTLYSVCGGLKGIMQEVYTVTENCVLLHFELPYKMSIFL